MVERLLLARSHADSGECWEAINDTITLLEKLAGNDAYAHGEISHDQADDLGRIAYRTYCEMDPLDEEAKPDWGRTGYKAQSAVWQAIAHNVVRALTPARPS